MENEINTFLKRFHEHENVTDAFTSGCCYWFAYILHSRFEGSIIMYDEVMNHFGTKIGNSVYDITGNVTLAYDWKPWSELSDELLKDRIVRDCILFLDSEN